MNPNRITRVISNQPHYTENPIAKKYQTSESENVLKSAQNYLIKKYKPSRTCLNNYVNARFPIFKWVKNYNIRNNIIKDAISGVTIGIIEIPQSMGYSLMAGLPAINGLYTSFFSAMMYLIFGTARHMSIGTYGIVAVMIENYIEKLENILYSSDEHASHNIMGNLTSNMFISNNPKEAKIMIATTFAFLVGIFHLVFGIFHGGVVTKYLSDITVAAFTTGAAYFVVVSELKSILGIKLESQAFVFFLIGLLIDLFRRIRTINFATVVVSLVCMFVLYMVKHFVNHKYKDKLIAPIPIEFIVITFSTVFSYVFNFETRFGIEIIGNIPLGIPSPRFPPLYIISFVWVNALEIAIVSFALNISMAKLFAKKYKYAIRPNQELFAYGIGNIIVSFFQGFPASVGISRCVILDTIGVKSLLHALISSIIVLIFIVGLGFLMKPLPLASLASLIVVALIPMLTEVKRIVPIFKRSKLEALAWIATFLGVVILDIDEGLYIGIGFSLLLFIFQNQRAFSFLMGNIPDTDIYEAIDICDEAKEIEGIKIIRYESSIFYANVDNFVYKIGKLSGVNQNEVLERINDKIDEYSKSICPNLMDRKEERTKPLNQWKKRMSVVSAISRCESESNQMENEVAKILKEIKIKNIIIDFSCVNIIDSCGVDTIAQMCESYEECGVQIHLSHCKRNVISRFNKVKDKFSMESIYPTTHEAVLSILNANAFNNQLVSGHVSNTPSLIYDQNENTYEQVDIKIDLFSNDLMKRSSKNNFDVFEAAVFQN